MKPEIEFNPNWELKDCTREELVILTFQFAKEKHIEHYNLESIAKEFLKESMSSVRYRIWQAKKAVRLIYRLDEEYENVARKNLAASYVWSKK